MIVSLIWSLEDRRSQVVLPVTFPGTQDNRRTPHLPAHAGLLKQVLLDLGSFDGASLVEVDVDVLPEATGVVVTDGLCVAEGLLDERDQVRWDRDGVDVVNIVHINAKHTPRHN